MACAVITPPTRRYESVKSLLVRIERNRYELLNRFSRHIINEMALRLRLEEKIGKSESKTYTARIARHAIP